MIDESSRLRRRRACEEARRRVHRTGGKSGQNNLRQPDRDEDLARQLPDHRQGRQIFEEEAKHEDSAADRVQECHETGEEPEDEAESLENVGLLAFAIRHTSIIPHLRAAPCR